MDTESLLTEAVRRTVELDKLVNGNPDSLFEALGIIDHDVLREWTHVEAHKVIANGVISMLLQGERQFETCDYVSVGILNGIAVGYQLALMREERETE